MSEERFSGSGERVFSDLQIRMIEFMIFDYDESSMQNSVKLMAESLGVDKDEIGTKMRRLEVLYDTNRTDAVTKIVRIYVSRDLGDTSRIPRVNREEYNTKENQLLSAFHSGWTNHQICENLHCNMDNLNRLKSPIFKKLNTKSRFLVVAALTKSRRANV